MTITDRHWLILDWCKQTISTPLSVTSYKQHRLPYIQRKRVTVTIWFCTNAKLLIFCWKWQSSAQAKIPTIFWFGQGSTSRVEKPDIDSLVKFVLDALKGIGWSNDHQVAVITAYKCIDLHPLFEGQTIIEFKKNSCCCFWFVTFSTTWFVSTTTANAFEEYASVSVYFLWLTPILLLELRNHFAQIELSMHMLPHCLLRGINVSTRLNLSLS